MNAIVVRRTPRRFAGESTSLLLMDLEDLAEHQCASLGTKVERRIPPPSISHCCVCALINAQLI